MSIMSILVIGVFEKMANVFLGKFKFYWAENRNENCIEHQKNIYEYIL